MRQIRRRRKSGLLAWMAGVCIELIAVAAVILLVAAGRVHRWHAASGERPTEIEHPAQFDEAFGDDARPMPAFDLDRLR